MSAPRIMEPGVYFGLAEDEYHAAFALSASGIKHLRVSPLDFWVRSPLNPNPDAETDADTFAKMLGRAYHKRIVEGREAFAAAYAPEISRDDYPGALVTIEDLKAALTERGAKPKGRKDELIEQLLSLDPAAKIWEAIREGYEAEHEGKSFLPPRNIEKIEIAAAMIEKHPHLSKAFTGGAPEVSIFWNADAELEDGKRYQVPMKCRVDYLKPKAIVELKTFGNPHERPIDRAIASAFAGRRYHIAAALYCEGVAQVPGLIKNERVFGRADDALLEALAKRHEMTYFMVWQATGCAPVARGMVFPTASLVFGVGETEVRAAKEKFAACVRAYGYETPWLDIAEVGTIQDGDIPSWAME